MLDALDLDLDQPSRTFWLFAINVADPGSVSLIAIFIHLGSGIPDPTTSTKEEGKKISCPTFF